MHALPAAGDYEDLLTSEAIAESAHVDEALGMLESVPEVGETPSAPSASPVVAEAASSSSAAAMIGVASSSPEHTIAVAASSSTARAPWPV